LPAGRPLEALGPGPSCRALAAPAHDAHTKGFPYTCHGGANMAEGIDAEGAPKQARADRRMPLAVFQALHFIGQMAQRRQDHAPREFGGGGIGTPAPAAPASRDHDAVLGTSSDI